MIKPAVDKDGYLRVTFSHNGKRKCYYVHQLVALAFIKNVNNKLTVNHKDGCKTNNNVLNLEWATHKEQKVHAINHHLCDRNIEALIRHNKEASKPLFFKGKKYNSIRETQRLTGSDWRTIKRKGIFL